MNYSNLIKLYFQNQLHNIKNPLKSKIYEQIAKYLTADNSVVHSNNANTLPNNIHQLFTEDLLWTCLIKYQRMKDQHLKNR
jgi:hypothetical protein